MKKVSTPETTFPIIIIKRDRLTAIIIQTNPAPPPLPLAALCADPQFLFSKRTPREESVAQPCSLHG
ncbi:hypothetical protein JZ751_008903 [Albula glossodonta]|uniref:Uncharacterized protein n=1 Tax=Albula glossodonta TaxID=121402 RepID=A0A8T2P094_9TELE|nr:hypothetical protein JZ751_008903 [Albula glossodonta]